MISSQKPLEMTPNSEESSSARLEKLTAEVLADPRVMPFVEKTSEESEIEKCRNYIYWRRHYAFSDDKKKKKVQFPWLPYNQYVAAILASDDPRPAFDKSRQMLISWEVCAYFVWTCMFESPIETIIVSKVQRDVDYMLAARMRNIWGYQSGFLREFCPAEFNKAEAVYSNGSFTVALPEGDDPLRGYQPSIIFFDECGHQDSFDQRYTAAIPMVERIILAGTPNGHGAWWRIVKDIRAEAA